jgi:hypothetical protein
MTRHGMFYDVTCAMVVMVWKQKKIEGCILSSLVQSMFQMSKALKQQLQIFRMLKWVEIACLKNIWSNKIHQNVLIIVHTCVEVAKILWYYT